MNRQNYWWMRGVIYEFYVDKFAGSFKSLVDRLDYLEELGVNILWVLPHYPSPMVDGGYDVSNYESVREDLGTLDDFDNFIAAAHEKGMKVVLDLVLNHTSSKHPWFVEASSSKDNPKRHWYLWSDSTTKFADAFVHFPNIKSSNWIFNEATGDYYYATFYPQQPDLNWDNEEVFRAMVKIIDFWLDRGVDGFRLDAVSRLVKRDGTNCFALPETHSIIKNIRSHIAKRNPDILLIAESGGWPSEAKTFFGDGDECQMVINFPLSVNILASIVDGDDSYMYKIWSESSGIPDGCQWALFLTNHDSVDLFFLSSERREKFVENLGQNKRLFSDGNSYALRLAEVFDGDLNRIISAYKKMFSFDATSIIYYGNEIGMRNEVLSYRPSDFREYVRGYFDWKMAEHERLTRDSLLNTMKSLIKDRLNAKNDIV